MKIEWKIEQKKGEIPMHVASLGVAMLFVHEHADTFESAVLVSGRHPSLGVAKHPTLDDAREACRQVTIDALLEFAAALALATHVAIAPPIDRAALKREVEIALLRKYPLRWAGHRIVGRDESRMPSSELLDELAAEVRAEQQGDIDTYDARDAAGDAVDAAESTFGGDR